jgi:hypothetical protein
VCIEGQVQVLDPFLRTTIEDTERLKRLNQAPNCI